MTGNDSSSVEVRKSSEFLPSLISEGCAHFIAIPAIRSVPALDLTAVSFCNVPDSDDRARENCAEQPVSITVRKKNVGSVGLGTARKDSFIFEVVQCTNKKQQPTRNRPVPRFTKSIGTRLYGES